jgi:hypothetical protein
VVALCIPLLVLAVLALTVSPCYWAAAAVVTAVCSRALVEIGLLPEFARYFDIPLAFAAFAFAALTTRSWSATAQWVALGVGGLGCAVALSGILAGSSALQWLLSYGVLGGPFAVVAAVLLAAPSPRERKALITMLLTLAFIQVPISIVQAIQASHPDEVQGTLVGSAAGAHLLAGITAVAAFWLIARARTGLQLLCTAPLLIVPFLSGAQQVIAAMPAAFAALAVWYPGGGLARRMRTMVLLGAVAFLSSVPILLDLGYAHSTVARAFSGESGKVKAVAAIETELTRNPGQFFFGAGPAQTVSHSALLVTDPESSIAQTDLGLTPSPVLQDIGVSAGSSAADAPSSALGVFGDLGLFGGLIYYALIAFLFISAWRLRAWEGAAAAAALTLFFILGFTFTWWEETGFSLYVALLVGVALARGRHVHVFEPPHERGLRALDSESRLSMEGSGGE